MFTKSAVNEAADVITARKRLFYKLYTNNYRYARADRLEILNFIAIKLVAKYVAAAATDTHTCGTLITVFSSLLSGVVINLGQQRLGPSLAVGRGNYLAISAAVDVIWHIKTISARLAPHLCTLREKFNLITHTPCKTVRN
jgi:hypothetical protein